MALSVDNKHRLFKKIIFQAFMKLFLMEFFNIPAHFWAIILLLLYSIEVLK